ncbi:hypothetical protein H1Q59_08870, partial [Holosporaceae bacterium 'Namur']|nr:hypothetical protein [Holosporaceae bacterium 'Namur']
MKERTIEEMLTERKQEQGLKLIAEILDRIKSGAGDLQSLLMEGRAILAQYGLGSDIAALLIAAVASEEYQKSGMNQAKA